MPVSESGTYRMLPGSPGADGITLFERWAEEPVTVRADGYEEPLASTVGDLRPGNLVEATLEWPAEGHPAVADLSVATGTLFAFVDGADHVFAEFRDGRRTLEPMVEKLGEGGAEPPYEVFVIRPAGEPFVVVYLAIDRSGLLADTVREEFDLPRE